jgi:hypothetical protein
MDPKQGGETMLECVRMDSKPGWCGPGPKSRLECQRMELEAEEWGS